MNEMPPGGVIGGRLGRTASAAASDVRKWRDVVYRRGRFVRYDYQAALLNLDRSDADCQELHLNV